MNLKNEGNEDRTMDFSGLILGFGSAALSYMGFTSSGKIDEKNRNLALARQNIEILEILMQKTSGNLTNEEHHLLEHVLADLRMKFVESTK